VVPERTPANRPPLALIVTDQEWSTRSIESILGPKGYAVLRAYSGREAIERARSGQPDVIILDTHLPDQDGLQVCRALRDQSVVSASTPILVTSTAHPSRPQRLAALQAGAWESLSHPVDAEELLLKLDTFVRAKFAADHARDEGLLDLATGLYNVRGLARRAREVGAEAFRRRTALACVVVGIDPVDGTETTFGTLEHLAHAIQQTGRVSDAIGRLGRSEFAVIAPSTDAAGAVKLAQRLAEALEQSGPEFRVRAGYDAVDNLHDTPMEPVDLLVHATSALRKSRAEGNGNRFVRYESAVEVAR
jgi:diguanylate cyclase (GGDEF)-like protein